MSRALRKATVALAVVLVAAGNGVARARLDRLAEEFPEKQALLYLPNGEHLNLMSLGHPSLVADAIYLWAIQYYSDYDREDRYRYVEHVFSRVITELDPHYIDAYWLGALILTLEARDLEAGLRLLDKGVARNPEDWILLYIAAWECYHAKDYERAAGYFARAGSVPGAPEVVRRMRAGMIAKAGELGEAVGMWRELRDDPAADPHTVAIAARQVRELQVRADVEGLRRAIERFRSENRRNPQHLEELQRRGYIRNAPKDPDGREYDYNPRSGVVSSPARHLLGGNS